MISKKEVQHIAQLARLKLTEKEITKIQKDLAIILDYFKILKSQKLKVKSQKYKSEVKSLLRKDETLAKNLDLASDLISASPDKKDGYIKVKAVL